MKSLLKYEIRKILKKRLAIISIAAVLLFSMMLSFVTYQNMHAFDGKTQEGSGKAAVTIEKEIASKYKGTLTTEKVKQIMTDFKPASDLQGMNAQYVYYNALQSAVFYRFSDIHGNWNGLNVSDVFGSEKIKIGYISGWIATSINLARVMIALSFVLILLAAPIFSGEYDGVDNIILTSRYGKTKCATAKVAAGMIVAISVTVLIVLFHLIMAVALYGMEGWDCSILFTSVEYAEGYIPFNITCGTLIKYQILLSIMSAICVTGQSLVISSVCKNKMIALVLSAVLYVIPIMLPISEANPLYRIIVLMPLYYSQYISILSVEQMANGMLYAVWSIPVALLFLVVGAFVSPRIFAKHQVS